MHYVKVQFRKRRYYSTKFDGIRLAYHKYGLKYLALLLTLSAYSFIGAGIFLFFEKPAEIERVSRRHRTFEDLRLNLVRQMVDNLFNDSQRPLIFVEASQIEALSKTFTRGLRTLEDVITEYNSKHNMEPLLRWDLWTALIYAWTVITTIGYGHLYPLTVGGRIATMLYALVGIPLMLTALSNVGKLLTKWVKYPFFIVKSLGRRLFRYCTKMSREQILEADRKDKSRLEVFDLPIPVAIMLVIGWIFLCSAITLIWEEDWDYLVAFYFFFISLSTIGFGDVVPSKPYYLLLMFGNTMVGMALVSMLLKLIQGKLAPIATDDEVDPFDVERNRLRRAFRSASIFSNVPWPEEGEEAKRHLQIGANANLKSVAIAEEYPEEEMENVKRKKYAARRKSKQGATTGGAVVSALSTFLVPLFSAAASQQTARKISTSSRKSATKMRENSGDDGHIESEEIKENHEREDIDGNVKPLNKTVSFQDNELAILNGQLCEQADQLQYTDQVASTGRTVVLVDETERGAVRLRRTDTLTHRKDSSGKKKRRTGSVKEGTSKLSDVAGLGAGDGRDKKGARRSTRRSRGHHSKRHAQAIHTEDEIAERQLFDGGRRSVLSSPYHAVDWNDSPQKKRTYMQRAGTAPESATDNSAVTENLQESHSACSICAYHRLAADESEVIDYGRAKVSDEGYPINQNAPNWLFGAARAEQTLIIDLDDQSICQGETGQISQESKWKSQLHRQHAIDQRVDALPGEAGLLDWIERGVSASSYDSNRLGRARIPHSWSRHSISTDAVLDTRLPGFPMLPTSHSDQRCFSMKDGETQTMISFPSLDSDSRISVSGERGTTRLLPDSVSLSEINRLVDLHINAEILRNELAALAMADLNAAGDLRAYQRVLSLQEMIDQVNHEASLPRGTSYNLYS